MGEPTIAGRIANAQTAINTHAALINTTEEPLEDQLTDLSTDLQHLAVKRGLDFENLVQRAEYHHTEETDHDQSYYC